YDSRVGCQWIRRERKIAIALVDEIVIGLLLVRAREIWAGKRCVGRSGHGKLPLNFFAPGDFMLYRSGGTNGPVLSVRSLDLNALDSQVFRTLVVDLRFDRERLAG